jgi:predicted DNA-binding transcriptional regulator AlpA
LSGSDELQALAIERKDIIEIGGIGSPDVISSMMPVDAEAAMKILGVSVSELVAMVKANRLPRPGKRRNGKVAWPQVEIHAVKDWIIERREDGLPLE